MRTPEQGERKAHRFVDSDGIKIEVVAISVIGAQTYLEFVREGGRLVYRMRRPEFETTFSPVGVHRIREAANQDLEHADLFALLEMPAAA
jgi:hypothetical protein